MILAADLPKLIDGITRGQWLLIGAVAVVAVVWYVRTQQAKTKLAKAPAPAEPLLLGSKPNVEQLVADHLDTRRREVDTARKAAADATKTAAQTETEAAAERERLRKLAE